MFSHKLALTRRNILTLGRSAPLSRRSAWRHARQPFAGLDPLEARMLLSVVIAATGKSATYTDVDGDAVTVAVSAGVLTAANFTTTPTGLGDQLELIDLTTGGFAGTNLTVTVKRAATGDGLANIGYINATGVNLGTVTINGDLGRIDAGNDSALLPAIKLLSVRSLGREGLATQGGTGNLASNINGLLGSLVVKGDVQDAFIGVTGGARAEIGTINIAGSLIGGSIDHTGEIQAATAIGTITLGGDLQGSSGLDSGAIISGGVMGPSTFGGSFLGSTGDNSGSLVAAGGMGVVTIAGDVRGRSGTFSGAVESTGGGMAGVKIGGSLFGSSGTSSGEIFAGGGIKSVLIAHDLLGSTGLDSGSIQSSAGLGTVTIGGSVSGNAGDNSGLISAAGIMGSVSVKDDIRGSSGANSGAVNGGGTLASITVGGALLGGSGENSGQIVVASDIIKAVIAGDIRGGSAAGAGLLSSTGGQIVTATVGGSLLGGSDVNTGEISAATTMGSIKVALDIHGGSGAGSGLISSGTGKIAAVAVGGSIIGGSANQTGEIVSGSDLGLVSVGGSLLGSGVSGTASLDQTAAIISAGRLASVIIGGSVVSGANLGSGALTNSGTIRAGDDIGILTVKGSLIGNTNSTNSSPVIISAYGNVVAGATTDVAIGKITIGGRVQLANILAGYTTALVPANADAQIGAVAVGGDWVTSNLVAGAENSASGNVNFGDANDAKISGAGVNDVPGIFSKIASVAIKGFVYGSPLVANGPTHFGFVAETIGAFQFGGVTIPAHAAPSNLLIPPTSNVTLDEI